MEVIKLFPRSTKHEIKFIQLINVKMPTTIIPFNNYPKDRKSLSSLNYVLTAPLMSFADLHDKYVLTVPLIICLHKDYVLTAPLMSFADLHDKYVLTVPLITALQIGQSWSAGAQDAQDTR